MSYIIFDQKEYSKNYYDKNKEKYTMYNKKYYEKNKESIKERRKPYSRAYGKLHPYKTLPIEQRMLYAARRRAKKAGTEFSITIEDIKIPETCPILGIKLSTHASRYDDRASVASLDRVDPTKGYIKDNIEVISHLANTMKCNATKEQLLSFSKEMLKRYGMGV